jgi:hypothetical protein
MCCKHAGAKSVTEKITEGHGPGEQLPKMRERLEDFWELRGFSPRFYQES